MAERRPSAGSSALNAIAQQEQEKKYSLQGRTQVAPRVQTMQNARPTVRSALSNLMRDAVDATGLGGGYRQGLLNAAGGVETAADFLPVVGDVLGLEDASRAYRQGDMVGAGINMMGVVPIVGDATVKLAKKTRSALRDIDAEVSEARAIYDLDPSNKELRQSYMALRRERDSIPPPPRIRRGRGSAIRVFHGSPYEFENFSINKINTGEGAQAYGHGLYFAESPEIARSYRDQLSQSGSSIGGRPIIDNYNSIIERADRLPPAAAQIEYDKAAFLENLELTDDIAESIGRIENPEVAKWARSEVAPQFKPAGYSYEANLNVQSDDLLDWDKPLVEQPRALNVIKQMYLDDLKRIDANSPDGEPKLSELFTSVDDVSIEDLGLFPRSGGGQAYNTIAASNMGRGVEELSRKLKERGIKGIKYFDGFSRRSEGGTSNYVMFDDSLIDTKRVNDKLTPSWMNQDARMQRAQDLGFNTDRPLYHYTDKLEDGGDFNQLSISPDNVQTKLGRGIYTSPDNQYGDRYIRKKRDMSDAYGENARAIPVYARGNMATDVDYDAAMRTARENLGIKGRVVPDRETKLKIGNEIRNEAQKLLKDQGFSGVQFMDEVMIFDPKDVRSINAEFDTTKADSADLLSNRQSERQMSALRGIA